MKKLRGKIKDKPYIVLTIPLVLCCIKFISNLYAALKDGNVDSTEYSQLLLTADGFEAVILILYMRLKSRK